MRRVTTACILLAVLAQAASASPPEGEMTLTLPHPIAPGESAWIEIQVGAIARGQEIEVTAASGRVLGVISPFGVRVGQDAGTYTLPVPTDAIRDRAIIVRLTLTRYGAPPRPPTEQEVRSVKLILAAPQR